MKNLNFRFIIVSLAVVLLPLVIGITIRQIFGSPQIAFLQTGKPKCTCYFPDNKKYGIRDEKEGCKIVDCIAPEKTPSVEETGVNLCNRTTDEKKDANAK